LRRRTRGEELTLIQLAAGNALLRPSYHNAQIVPNRDPVVTKATWLVVELVGAAFGDEVEREDAAGAGDGA
jgi:hypothetical protein